MQGPVGYKEPEAKIKKMEAPPPMEERIKKGGIEVSEVRGRDYDVMIKRIEDTAKTFYGVLNK